MKIFNMPVLKIKDKQTGQWENVPSLQGSVSSVNNKTGNVILTPADFNAIDKTKLAQKTGPDSNKVMSQKAVTDALNGVINDTDIQTISALSSEEVMKRTCLKKTDIDYSVFINPLAGQNLHVKSHIEYANTNKITLYCTKAAIFSFNVPEKYTIGGITVTRMEDGHARITGSNNSSSSLVVLTATVNEEVSFFPCGDYVTDPKYKLIFQNAGVKTGAFSLTGPDKLLSCRYEVAPNRRNIEEHLYPEIRKGSIFEEKMHPSDHHYTTIDLGKIVLSGYYDWNSGVLHETSFALDFSKPVSFLGKNNLDISSFLVKMDFPFKRIINSSLPIDSIFTDENARQSSVALRNDGNIVVRVPGSVTTIEQFRNFCAENSIYVNAEAREAETLTEFIVTDVIAFNDEMTIYSTAGKTEVEGYENPTYSYTELEKRILELEKAHI